MLVLFVSTSLLQIFSKNSMCRRDYQQKYQAIFGSTGMNGLMVYTTVAACMIFWLKKPFAGVA